MKNERIELIGVPISAVNMDSCLEKLFEDFEANRGRYLCFANVHTTVMAHDDPAYRKVQAESLMSLPDGKPLSVLGRKQCPDMGQVRGVDLMRRLFSEAEARPLRHYFYGNTQETLDLLLKRLRENYPALCIAGAEPSVFRDMSGQEEAELAERINAAEPDFVWVSLGAPRQEFFCARMQGKLHALSAGVGGAFNVLAGAVPDAPRWMRRLGLEWLYRLSREPGRLFRRYAVTNTRFLWCLLTEHPRAKKHERG